MNYSEEELIQLYRQSKNQLAEKKIIGELARMKPAAVDKMLETYGYGIHMFKSQDMELRRAELEKHFADGGTLSQLSAKYKSDNNSMKKILNEMGIKTPSKSESMRHVGVIKKEQKETVKMELGNLIKVIMDLKLNFTSGSAMAYLVKATDETDVESKINCLTEAKEYIQSEIEHLKGDKK